MDKGEEGYPGPTQGFHSYKNHFKNHPRNARITVSSLQCRHHKSLSTAITSCNQHTLTYPSSIRPFTNSSFVKTHCVAAPNFHARMRTVRLSGFKPRSSRNRIIPSAVILSSSCGSVTRMLELSKHNVLCCVSYFIQQQFSAHRYCITRFQRILSRAVECVICYRNETSHGI